jgi:integrase
MPKRGKRRGRGEGSVFQRKDGLWVAEVTTGYREDGTPVRETAYAPTKAEVLDKLKDLQVRKGGQVAEREWPFRTVLDLWLTGVKGLVEPSSLVIYKRVVDKWLRPVLGHLKVGALTSLHVHRLYEKMDRAGASRHAQAYAGSVLRMVFRKCLVLGILDRDPTEGVPRPKVARRTYTLWTAEEVGRFLQAAGENPDNYPIYLLGLDGSLRAGEVAGLDWGDLDLTNGTVRVTRNYRRVPGVPGVKGYQLAETKTEKSRRTVHLTTQTVESLLTYRDRARQAGRDVTKGPVFFGNTGHRRNPHNLDKALKIVLRKAGLPLIRFHDLRHHCASLLLSGGENLKVVQERLGHSSPTTTLATYAHVLPTAQAQAARRLEGLLRPACSPTVPDQKEQKGQEDGLSQPPDPSGTSDVRRGD